MPNNPEVQMEEEDAITCIHLCMQLGAPHPPFSGSLEKAFPGQINLTGTPLRTIQNIWPKYYASDKVKHEEVNLVADKQLGPKANE